MNMAANLYDKDRFSHVFIFGTPRDNFYTPLLHRDLLMYTSTLIGSETMTWRQDLVLTCLAIESFLKLFMSASVIQDT